MPNVFEYHITEDTGDSVHRINMLSDIEQLRNQIIKTIRSSEELIFLQKSLLHNLANISRFVMNNRNPHNFIDRQHEQRIRNNLRKSALIVNQLKEEVRQEFNLEHNIIKEWDIMK